MLHKGGDMQPRVKQNIEHGTGALPLMKVPAGQMTPELEQRAYAAQAEYMQGRPDPGHRFDHMRPGGRGSHLDSFLQGHGRHEPAPSAAGMARQNLGGGGGSVVGIKDFLSSARGFGQQARIGERTHAREMKGTYADQQAHAVNMLGMKQDHDITKHNDTHGLAVKKFGHDVHRTNVGYSEDEFDQDGNLLSTKRRLPGAQFDAEAGRAVVADPVVDHMIDEEEKAMQSRNAESTKPVVAAPQEQHQPQLPTSELREQIDRQQPKMPAMQTNDPEFWRNFRARVGALEDRKKLNKDRAQQQAVERARQGLGM